MNDKVKIKKKPKNPNIVPYGPETIARYQVNMKNDGKPKRSGKRI